jgi:hypothetical protein
MDAAMDAALAELQAAAPLVAIEDMKMLSGKPVHDPIGEALENFNKAVTDRAAEDRALRERERSALEDKALGKK